MSGGGRTPIHEGLLAVHGAIVLMGVTALFSKWISLPALDITLWRSLFAAGALALFVLARGAPLGLAQRRDYAMAGLLGTLLALHWATYFHSMQVSSVAVGIIALHAFPVLTVFLEPLFHGEKPQGRDLAAGLLVLLGIYLLVPDFSFDNATLQGVLWGLLSALLYALRNVLQRRYFHATRASHSLLFQAVAVVIVLAPFAGAGGVAIAPGQWLQLLMLGVFFTALPHTLFAHSLRFLRAKTASLVACLQVVYATLFAAVLLGEVPGWATVLGGVLVVGASVFETYGVGRSRAGPGPSAPRHDA